jgi:hypothetical protein
MVLIPVLAPTGPPAMSAVRSLSGVNRTSDGQPNSVENDRNGHRARHEGSAEGRLEASHSRDCCRAATHPNFSWSEGRKAGDLAV